MGIGQVEKEILFYTYFYVADDVRHDLDIHFRRVSGLLGSLKVSVEEYVLRCIVQLVRILDGSLRIDF